MKFFKNFLLVLAIVLSSLRPKPSETSEGRIINDNKLFGNQALLEYVGNLSGSNGTGSIGIQVFINTAIGVRYEVTMNIGAKSHIALFYKFSNPYQTVFYNFLTHKSTVMKGSGSIDPDPDVEIIGPGEKVNTYSCVHLRHGAGTEEVSDYWMSPLIPSWLEIVSALKAINTNLPNLAFSGTVFKWGGLVKWTDNFVVQGQTVSFELHLQKANTDVTLPSSTFDVPSK